MKNSFLRPSRSVSQPKNNRAEHRARQIGAAREADIGIGELQHRACLERARDRAGERHLKAVENPRDAERHDDQRMETAPRQPVEPRRDVGFDDQAIVGSQAGAIRPHTGMNARSGLVRSRPGRRHLSISG